MKYFIHQFAGLPYDTPTDQFVVASQDKSLLTGILSAGTFFGAIIAGDCADFFGRRTTIIGGCVIFAVGVILQVASSHYGLLSAGRFISGLGVGFESSIVIL